MLEISVRYIPTEHAVVEGQVFSTGAKPALCIRDREKALGMVNGEEGIRLLDLTLFEHDRSPEVRYGEGTYPPELFIEHMRRVSKEKPVGPRAASILKTYPKIQWEPENQKPTVTRSNPEKKKSQSNIIATIALELKATPQLVRKFLRSQGMRAPYTDEKQIRKLTKKGIDQ